MNKGFDDVRLADVVYLFFARLKNIVYCMQTSMMRAAPRKENLYPLKKIVILPMARALDMEIPVSLPLRISLS